MKDPVVAAGQFEIFARDLDHPECVAFDRDGFLWAGGEAGQVYRIDPAGRVETVAHLGGFCAGLAFSPADELFVCNTQLGLVHVQRSGAWSLFANAADGQKMVCPNFAVFDSRGSIYVTDSGQWQKRNGYLMSFRPDGSGQIIGGPYGYANGLALSADERFLFMVESDTDRIYGFRLQPDGSLGAAEVYADQVGRLPDGLALDAAQNLYVACYASDEIHCITPQREKMLFAHDRWAILLSRPTNLAFGGASFDEIYVANLGRTTVTRARVGRMGQPLANQRTGSAPVPQVLEPGTPMLREER